MIFNLNNSESNTKLFVLTWNNLPSTKEFYDDVKTLNSLMGQKKDYKILMNFMQLGKQLEKVEKNMWEVTTLLNILHYKKISRLGIAVPEKTAGKVMVKLMFAEIIGDQSIDVGFFDTLQECTLWSTN